VPIALARCLANGALNGRFGADAHQGSNNDLAQASLVERLKRELY